MKFPILTICLVATCLSAAQGQVMQKKDKIEESWGAPTKRMDSDFPVTEQCGYKKDGWGLAVSYMNDSAIKVIYVKTDNSAITAAQIEKILAANRKTGTWVVTDRSKEGTTYKNEKDHIEAVISGSILILTNSTIASFERGELK